MFSLGMFSHLLIYSRHLKFELPSMLAAEPNKRKKKGKKLDSVRLNRAHLATRGNAYAKYH